MRGCAVSRRYINVCNCDVFSVVYVYLDHLSPVLCVLMVEGMSVVVNVEPHHVRLRRHHPANCSHCCTPHCSVHIQWNIKTHVSCMHTAVYCNLPCSYIAPFQAGQLESDLYPLCL